jgi:hypothetical protein
VGVGSLDFNEKRRCCLFNYHDDPPFSCGRNKKVQILASIHTMQVSLAHTLLTFRPRSVRLTRMRDHAVKSRVLIVLEAAFAVFQMNDNLQKYITSEMLTSCHKNFVQPKLTIKPRKSLLSNFESIKGFSLSLSTENMDFAWSFQLSDITDDCC